MLGLSLIVFLVVLASSASNFLTRLNPDLALSLNPLNAQARLNKLTVGLAQENTPDKLASLKKMTIRGIKLDPVDARFYSLLGVINEQQGNAEPAQRLYTHSLKLLPTEIQALTRRYVYHVNSRNYVEAVSLADIILRRWNTQWEQIKPFMGQLLTDKEAYQEALVRFAKYDAGKRSLIESLSNNVASSIIARRLIRDWHNQGIKNLRPEINNLTAKLLEFEQYLGAYRLFLLTLSEAEKKQSGYIFNGNFDLEPTGNRFDWRLIKQAGMTSRITQLPSSVSNAGMAENVFEIRFLDAPIRFSQILQNLMLPPSNFTLGVTYSAENLKTVKPINLQIECNKSGKPLAVLSFKPGNIKNQKIETSFKVPPSNCKLLMLRIYNDKFVESWNNRYSGSLYLHKISINLSGA